MSEKEEIFKLEKIRRCRYMVQGWFILYGVRECCGKCWITFEPIDQFHFQLNYQVLLDWSVGVEGVGLYFFFFHFFFCISLRVCIFDIKNALLLNSLNLSFSRRTSQDKNDPEKKVERDWLEDQGPILQNVLCRLPTYWHLRGFKPMRQKGVGCSTTVKWPI